MVPSKLRKVVLPPPEGPLMITNYPLLIPPLISLPLRVIFFSATTSSSPSSLYTLPRFSHSMIGSLSAILDSFYCRIFHNFKLRSLFPPSKNISGMAFSYYLPRLFVLGSFKLICCSRLFNDLFVLRDYYKL